MSDEPGHKCGGPGVNGKTIRIFPADGEPISVLLA